LCSNQIVDITLGRLDEGFLNVGLNHYFQTTLGLNEGFLNVIHMAQLLKISRLMEVQHFQNFGNNLPFQ
jgi:hypothetical protein